MSERESTTRKRKMLRRVRVTIRRFERFGIERGDIATVVMNGEVRVGELGYFKIVSMGYVHGGHRAFALVCEQDSTCYDGYDNGPRTPESACLRMATCCTGSHNATAYGRVCAVERDSREIETKLALRPFDERESADEIVPFDPASSSKRQVKITTGFRSAHGFKTDEMVSYTPANDFRDGELVAFKTDIGEVCVAHLYRSKGKVYKYFSKKSKRTHGRFMIGDIAELYGRCEPPQEDTEQENSIRALPGRGKTEVHVIGFDWPLYYLHDGDRITIERGRELTLSALVLVRNTDDEDYLYFARVCRIDGDTIRLCGVTEQPHDEPASLIVGVAIGKADHSECVWEKIAVLRAKLEELSKEDDQIIRCSARYEIEKQLFDLEHPKAEESEDDSEFEWPDEIEG